MRTGTSPLENPMEKNPNLTLTGPDLAALLCSRVCHDIISPVGACEVLVT